MAGLDRRPRDLETFWNGSVTAIGGIARIDGAAYKFAGDPTIVLDVPNGGYGSQTTVNDFEAALDQSDLQVTATRSIFTFQGGGVQLTMEYLSPVEPGDLRRQSIPMSYVLVPYAIPAPKVPPTFAPDSANFAQENVFLTGQPNLLPRPSAGHLSFTVYCLPLLSASPPRTQSGCLHSRSGWSSRRPHAHAPPRSCRRSNSESGARGSSEMSLSTKLASPR